MPKDKHFSDHYIDAINGDPENNYFTPILDELFKSIETPIEVCDIGCGNGLYGISIKNHYNCNYTGVDGSSYALEQAKNRGIDKLYSIGDFCTDKMPFPDNFFDLVICKDVLEHLIKPEFLVSEIQRITKPSGYALIHVPNHFPINARLKFVFTADIDPFKFFPDSNRWNFPHIRFFNKNSILNLFSLYHFTPYKNLSYHFVIFSRIMKYFPIKLLNKYSDVVSSGITFIFKKNTP
ncbi:MAG: class I SAM-dependent methyltransferase [Epsilonproteobacteria bacterium]|nr:class I SAM-dependent methyltransferase [Campylobacterota bacterium]